MNYKKMIIAAAMSVCLGCAPREQSPSTLKQSAEDLKSDFLRSLEAQKQRLLEFISEDHAVRLQAAEYLQTGDAYQIHLAKYLHYTASLGNDFDIFNGILEDTTIESLEESTRSAFTNSMQQVFSSAKISGENFFHFYMRPESYFSPTVSNELTLTPSTTFSSVFDHLKMILPQDFNYQTKLVIDPTTPGGSYDEESNTIVFGSHPPNISTVMGFIHEFGHSVFRFAAKDDLLLPYVSGLNEGYAELWANEIRNFNFSRDLFIGEDFRQNLDNYITFRRLIGFRYHLMALLLERQVRTGVISSVEDYKTAQRMLAKRYLQVDNFPPIVPILPQVRIAGYLPSYLLIEFSRASFEQHIDQTRMVETLLQIGQEIRGDLSPQHFRQLVTKLVRGYGVAPKTPI